MRHASLFSGIGGPEVAASMIGWDNVFHCEINPFGRQILNYWFPNSDSYEDITKTDFKRYRGTIDVLTGGFPCQPFSYAGKRNGQTDDRYLWPEMLRVIDEIRPTWVIGENVAGITTMVESGQTIDLENEDFIFDQDNHFHRYQYNETFTIERICKDLEQIGYSVQPVLIPACAVGAPHRRDRIFILAYNTDRSDDLRKPGENEGKDREERLSNRDAIRKPGESDIIRPEIQEPAPDPRRQRLERPNESWSGKEGQRMQIWGDTPGCNRANSLRPEERWKAFPTISPVYRRNDGIPFNVDQLAFPFGKWRTETIKAYGNAIVPQVMYRIFQCIERLTYENF